MNQKKHIASSLIHENKKWRVTSHGNRAIKMWSNNLQCKKMIWYMCEQSLNELLQYVHYIADLLLFVSIRLYILEWKKMLRVFFFLLVCKFFIFVLGFFFIYFFFWRLDGQQNNQQIYLKIDLLSYKLWFECNK